MPKARRGEIWLVDLGMVQKTRPALILGVAYFDHELAVVTYVPRTTSQRYTRFEVPHQAAGVDPGVFDAQGIGGIPDVRLMRKLGVLPGDTMAGVESAGVQRGENFPERSV